MDRQLLECLYVNSSSCNFNAPTLLKTARDPTALSFLQHLKGFVMGPNPYSLLVIDRTSATTRAPSRWEEDGMDKRSLQVKVHWESRGAQRGALIGGGQAEGSLER